MKPLTYKDAGVDINKADGFVEGIKKIAKQTPRSGVIDEIGGFGGLFSLNVANIENPVLVSSTDGVGTKLKIAVQMDKHDTIGIDLVAMCVNDIAVLGAKPLFFLDYFAMGRLDTQIATQVIQGIGEGCRIAHCALLGGETAEMPSVYKDNEYDLAGFSVGIVDNKKIIDGSDIRVGNMLIEIPSSGLHSNGFSLVRKICFEILKMKLEDTVDELGKTLGEELLTPTRIYSEIIQNLIRDIPINGVAHITGGGLVNNILRIIPSSCGVVLHKGSWDVPPVFRFLQEAGNIEEDEMMRVFNNGVGLVIIVPEKVVPDVLGRLRGMNENVYVIGEIVERKSSEIPILWV